jgi:hypothetical protein
MTAPTPGMPLSIVDLMTLGPGAQTRGNYVS